MDRKIEIKNKAWYDRKTTELKKVTRELRAFDWKKKLDDDMADALNKSFIDLLMSGDFAVHVSEKSVTYMPFETYLIHKNYGF